MYYTILCSIQDHDIMIFLDTISMLSSALYAFEFSSIPISPVVASILFV